MTSATDVYRASRDQLLALSGDHERAVAEFTWPVVGPVFNWAIDWFDAIAQDSEKPALVIVEENAARVTVTFDEMRRRSNRVARWLRDKGVSSGDSVIIMLGNQVELWESMLAVMKLGAVIVPTTTAVGPAELRDRLARTEARHVLCNPADIGKFDDVPGDYTRICTGPAQRGRIDPLRWRAGWI